MTKACLFILTCITIVTLNAQSISGSVTFASGESANSVSVFVEGSSNETKTNEKGEFTLDVQAGSYRIVSFLAGYETSYQDVVVGDKPVVLEFVLKELVKELDEVTVEETRNTQSINWLQSVSGAAIYEAKKTELIQVDHLVANKAANVSRQVYAKVPGLNIWESDGAGLQLGIGGRGLSPNRTSNFNTRQNGYDISADALGYPESYYTPPVLALERIELVRGAAGLQYGTQFGGMLNFVFKQGDPNRKIKFDLSQTAGSFGLINTFNSVGGTVGKVNYYAFYNFKNSDGWRPNSSLNQHVAYGSVRYNFTSFSSVRVEHTHMSYLAQQPGGLTDSEFYQDPRQSKRTRNWFSVGWDLTSMEWNIRVSPDLKFNNRTFHLVANRYAVGNLELISRPDDLSENRNLLRDNYHNVGNEFRTISHYTLLGRKSVLVVGNRIYFGQTLRAQGEANASSDASFRFLNPQEPENSDFKFPSRNVAFFAENIFNVTDRLSITPGVRYEYIRTDAMGYYFDRRRDQAGNIIYEEKVSESKRRSRDLVLVGVGVSFKQNENFEVYGNFSQNYRSINFNDIRIDNPSIKVDPSLYDEHGFNLDFGIRGQKWTGMKYDISAFYLSYNDRIGNVTRWEPDPRYTFYVPRPISYRKNVADAAIYGVESMVELDVLQLLGLQIEKGSFTIFNNTAFIKSVYRSSEDPGIEGNEVELVPAVNTKSGLSIAKNNLSVSYLFSFLTSQYTDAGNSSKPLPSAIDGLIPSFYVMDLSVCYKWKNVRIETGSNNLTNNRYYTRRASGYPGPGIIPSDGQSYYLTLGFTF